MQVTDLIRKKRDGETLSATEIATLVSGLADESIPAEQIAAFAMAVYFQSMSFAEAAELTRAMASSGDTLLWDANELGGPVVDKHSTGGVGDKVSFLLAPIAAACGLYVPMISGRGLGHSGGTLDKLSSVPGYNATPSLEQFRKVVAGAGCAIIGQTAELAPADRRFYSIRDITATVESIPLITASILSKKIAAGNHGLVMDIKWGSGAFMATLDDARQLARSLIQTAASAGLPTHALITDMNQVLGFTAGNALEIRESLDFLIGRTREKRLESVTLQLTAEMLLLSGKDNSRDAAMARARQALDEGHAAERFARMVSNLGGPADLMEKPDQYLPVAPVVKPVPAAASGYFSGCDTRAVGMCIVDLGGGRKRIDDALDLSVGFSNCLPLGSEVKPDTPMAFVHAASENAADRAIAAWQAACTITEQPATGRSLVEAVLTPGD